MPNKFGVEAVGVLNEVTSIKREASGQEKTDFSLKIPLYKTTQFNPLNSQITIFFGGSLSLEFSAWIKMMCEEVGSQE